MSGTRAGGAGAPIGLSEWLTAAIVGVLGTAMVLVRVPRGEYDVPWAEDGFLFLPEFLRLGPASLVEGYAGYQHLLPRAMTAFIVSAVPLEYYAITVFVACAAVTGVLAAVVYLLARSSVPYPPARLAIALITALVPLAGQEVLGNMADIHTYAMWLGLWLLCARPKAWWSSAVLAAAMFVAAATEVQLALYLLIAPLLVLRDRRRLPIAGALLAGVIWQMITFLTVPRPGSGFEWIGLASLVKGWLLNVVLPMAVPHLVAQRDVVAATGILVPLLALIPFALAIVYVAVKGTADQRILLGMLLLTAVAVYSAGAIVDGTDAFRYADGPTGLGERAQNARYGVLPQMAMLTTIPLAVAVWVQARQARARPALSTALGSTAVLAALIVVMAVASASTVSIRGWTASQWSYGVAVALESCKDLDAAAVQAIPIAPFRTAEVTCGDLRARASG
ncbi:hypothetical protein [Microbacterium sp. PRC9]|uniref:hypothetical protein n=1 Tax=Microbacterium sp. PRC9 TaxID=2962591 RepID=UPI0028817DA7|nr:hypothetical protein [Microbacterium sp. PRC9]MDT0141101.1 hypothetical protein [Microbacterium sp. PRC9]